jgi:hypothetical protein
MHALCRRGRCLERFVFPEKQLNSRDIPARMLFAVNNKLLQRAEGTDPNGRYFTLLKGGDRVRSDKLGLVHQKKGMKESGMLRSSHHEVWSREVFSRLRTAHSEDVSVQNGEDKPSGYRSSSKSKQQSDQSHTLHSAIPCACEAKTGSERHHRCCRRSRRHCTHCCRRCRCQAPTLLAQWLAAYNFRLREIMLHVVVRHR